MPRETEIGEEYGLYSGSEKLSGLAVTKAVMDRLSNTKTSILGSSYQVGVMIEEF